MYLSQLFLDPRSRNVIKDLNDPYQLHRTVMSGYPQVLPAGERVLFRLEISNHPPRIELLVESHTLPDWEHLAATGYILAPAAIKTFLPEFQANQVFNFRLVANPTKRLHGNEEEVGPRVGLFREEDQFAWLARKGGEHGFQVLEARAAHFYQPDGWKEEKGKTHRIRQFAVRFDGRLRVTEPEAFASAVAGGIGSGKSLGFGLLSLARPTLA